LILKRSIEIRIDFPAFSEFVAYLREGKQTQVDAIATAVSAATARLKQSQTALQGAIEKETK
jgi:hypothetical protein